MFKYLNHTWILDPRFESSHNSKDWLFCNKCNVRIYIGGDFVKRPITFISKNYNWCKLLNTCEEEIIKNIIE